MTNYFTTATEGDFGSHADFMKSWPEIKAQFDRIREKTLRSMAELAEIECPKCHRKVTVINGGDIVVCEHLIAALRDKCEPAPPGMPLDPFATQVFLLDDGPARFRDDRHFASR